MSNSYFSDGVQPKIQTKQKYIQIEEPVDIECQIGDSISISAVVKSPNPSFQWYDTYGKPLPTQNRSNLFFNSVMSKDFGFYRLEIVDGVTQERALTRWVQIKKRTKLQDRTSKPILVSSSLGGSYRVGGTFELTVCFDNATAYQWYKDGNRLEGCTGNILTVHNANVSNTGVYVLGAMNSSCGLIVNTDPIKIVIN